MARTTLSERIAVECHSLPLRLVHRVVSGIYDDALRPLDLRISQLNVLAAIELMGEQATPARVSGYLAIEKSTLSRDLERMRARGWIDIEPRRAGRKLVLTADGRELMARAAPAWEAAQRAASALLGQPMSEALRAVAEQAREEQPRRPASLAIG
jgi:DNA-binding MarR family transcriptional regulator